jgi:hypothetical protein
MAEKQKVLGEETYEPGTPSGPGDWRGKLKDRGDMLKYLRSGERYWYSEDWYGSEKRRTPA